MASSSRRPDLNLGFNCGVLGPDRPIFYQVWDEFLFGPSMVRNFS
jgi:hypothetical protein